jgi:hypothetical protein
VLPKITWLSPASAVAGSVVAVYGSGLELTSTVRFNGVAAALAAGSTTTALKAVVPATATSGAISVETAAGTAVSAAFKVLPKIVSFAPATGTVGTTVTIQGSGLAGPTSVKLGTVAMSVVSSSPTEVSAVVPAAGVTGKISVTTASRTATSAASFAVPPTISGFSPAAAAAGQPVTLTGSTFTGTTAVRVNGVWATYSVLSGGTQLRLTVPATAVSGPITVTNAGGTATSPTPLAVRPKVTSFTPTSGATGATVTVNGSGFVAPATVTFGGAAPVPATVLSPRQLKAVVPSGAVTGALQVATAAGTSAPSTSSFGVSFSVTGFAPAGGTPGTVVTVRGKGYVAPLTVRFGSVAGTGVVVDSPTQLRVTVPAGAQTAAISVAKGATAVTASGAFVVPRITGFAPVSASAGQPVVIAGADLVAPSFVLFGAAPASFTADSGSQVTAVVPAGLTGSVPITVGTLFGSVTSAGSFTPQP